MRWSAMPLEAQNRRKTAHFIALCGRALRGHVKIPHSRMTKTCRGIIGLGYVCHKSQKIILYHLLGVSDYYIMYRQRAKSIL